MASFFVGTALGCEKQTLQELREVWPWLLALDGRTQTEAFPEVEVVQGGLEFDCALATGLQLNFFLKTALRVLLRLDQFKVRDFPKMHSKFLQIPWTQYFSTRPSGAQIACRKSRLNNEKRVGEVLDQVLDKNFPQQKPDESLDGAIYIRVDDDVCTLSLDTSGEHLHKRAWAPLKGEAPLRENLASWLLREMVADVPLTALKEKILIDPFAGSGTFLLEARGLSVGVFHRPFTFQKWKNAPKLLLSEKLGFNYSLPPTPLFCHFMAIDLNPKMTEVVSANWQGQEQIWSQYLRQVPTASLEVKAADIFSLSLALPKLWVIANPPYGERLGGPGLEKILKHILTWQPERVGILYPDHSPIELSWLKGAYRVEKQIPVSNGGLRTLFSVLQKIEIEPN